jgi:hypothetical protein
MPRVSLWSLGLVCLWGGLASAAPTAGPAGPPPPAQKRPAAPAPAPQTPQAPAAVPDRRPGEDAATAALRHFEAGRELVDAGKLNEGLRELVAAYAGTPNPPPETEFYLGLAYDGLGRTDPAILAYRRYLARHPGSINARNVRERLTVLLQRRGEHAPPLPEEAAPQRPSAKGPFPPLRVESPPPAPTTPPRTH